MTEGPEVSVLIHELGGMLSSVQGFAHIAEANPEHPNRERFIGLAASEARRAAQAVKDLHLARTLDRGAIPASPPAVDAVEVLAAARREASLDAEAFPELDGIAVAVDPVKIAGLLARTWARAVAPARVASSGDGVVLVVPIARAEEVSRRAQALDAPYPDMVVLSLLRRILRHWGGDLTLAADGEWTVATITLPGA